MPKKSKTLCVDDLRHAEYYGMQSTFDELYQKSQNGEVFENLLADSYDYSRSLSRSFSPQPLQLTQVRQG